MLPKKKTGRVGGAEAGSPLQSIFAETAALANRLGLLRRQLHAGDARSLLGRGILHDLAQHGPQTVPHLARSRKVSRQHVQVLVNRLESEGQLEFVDNPAHQRSSLVRITVTGEKMFNAMEHREETHLSGLGIDLSEEKLRTAAVILQKLRESIGDAPRNVSRESTLPKRKQAFRKSKAVRPIAPVKADQAPPLPDVPEATSTDSDPDEFPISML